MAVKWDGNASGQQSWAPTQQAPTAFLRRAPNARAEVAERGGNGASERRSGVVPWSIRLAVGSLAAFVAVLMIARIPAVAGHVDATAESKAIVDDDDLLVVRRSGRMRAVQLGMDALVPDPVAQGEDGRTAKQNLDGPDIPSQQYWSASTTTATFVACSIRQQFLPGVRTAAR